MKLHNLRQVMLLGACLALPVFATTLTTSVVFSSQAQAQSQAEAAVAKAMRGDFMNGGALAQSSGDPAAIKLVELIYLRDHWKEAGYSRIMSFLSNAPDWPLTETLLKHAEKALYEHREPAAAVLAHFDKREVKTIRGQLALARAHFQAGNDEKGRKILRQAFVSPDLDVALEKEIMTQFQGRITAEDQRRRMNSLILAQQPAAAIRISKRLGADHQRAAKVAHALIRGVSGSDRQANALPTSIRNEPGIAYSLARFYRKQEKYDKARAILANMTGDADKMVDAEAVWTERRIIARRSVGINQRDNWKTAYRITANHGLREGTEAVEAEFLSGWIALRYLKDTETAMRHFARLKEIAPSRTEKSRAGYWIARTLEAQGDKAKAQQVYKQTSQYSTLFYGQLAREKVGLGTTPEEIISGETTEDAKNKVDRDEVVRAFRLMQSVNGKDNLYMFLGAMAARFDRVDQLNAVAAMVQNSGGTTMALKFAKAVGQRGIDIDSYSYPIRGLPDWRQVGKPIEKAMVFGLSRQESEFNPKAGSKVGAQGLMQLMPGTAKIVARQYSLPYAPSKLIGDPAYNVKLGAAHLADLVDDFNGSYILTLVAYNAGPRRASEWVEAYGDPRGGQVDPIDWVESIPFSETRQYVQKVMQNVHIYRSRLAPHTVKPMTADLKRGTPRELTVAATDPIEQPAANCGGFSISALIRACE